MKQLMIPACIVIIITIHFPLKAQTELAGKEFYIKKTMEPPIIDGVLDDEVWREAGIETGIWVTDSPKYGNKPNQYCEAFAAYDNNALYFAFRCHEPETGRIKTSVSRRDHSDKDDWVCIIIDPMNTRQVAYQHMVNPNGIKADAIFTSSGDWDKGIDWVWDSAARLTSEGYDVEMSVPLKSIRYKGGSETRMGICFRQRITHQGITTTWPDLPPGETLFTVMATLVYRGLPEQRTRELLPSLTYAHNKNRRDSLQGFSSEQNEQVGLGIKYGLTSSITLDGTFNPDFSQVESDEFQVEVNQRYPNFYTEKRPFFMEGIGLFSLPVAGSDVSMTKHIHTRRIVDPCWGLKLTGTIGKFSFGIISASDEAPGKLVEHDDQSRIQGRNKLFNIGRAVYNLGSDNYLGTIVTDTGFAGGFNRAIGIDGSYRFGNHSISGFAVYTNTRDPGGGDSLRGTGGSIDYKYSDMRWNIWLAGEHYDEDSSGIQPSTNVPVLQSGMRT